MFAVDNSLCNSQAIQPSKIQIQMDRLLCTSLYRALLKSLTRKAVSENRLRNYFHDFAQQAMTICDNTDALSALRILNYTQVKFRSLLRRVSERDTPPPHYLSRFTAASCPPTMPPCGPCPASGTTLPGPLHPSALASRCRRWTAMCCGCFPACIMTRA